MRTKEELEILSATLTLRERYALDAYIKNFEDKKARHLVFEMSLKDIPMWTKAAFNNNMNSFFKRNDVVAYLELDKLKSSLRASGADLDGIEAKDYATIIKELERDRQEAKDRRDTDNYQKFSKLLLDYMKSNKEEDINDDRVLYYVPMVCVDDCPLYKREQDRLNKVKNETLEEK